MESLRFSMLALGSAEAPIARRSSRSALICN
jgi:hypothetical protein